MKAKMDSNGNLLIFPETGVEAYALRIWEDNNVGSSDEVKIIIHKEAKTKKDKKDEKGI